MWCFHREWDVVVDHYSKATRRNGQLEFALNTSQATLSTKEVEVNMARVQLVEWDARVTGKIFNHLSFL